MEWEKYLLIFVLTLWKVDAILYFPFIRIKGRINIAEYSSFPRNEYKSSLVCFQSLHMLLFEKQFMHS